MKSMPFPAPSPAPSRTRELGLYATVVAVTLVVIAVTLRLWHIDLRVPLNYDGDALLISSHFKTIIETGWYLEQPLLGAPSGQEYFDWKIADNLGMFFGLLMRPFTSDFGVVQNLYYLVGYPLAAVTATWLLRRVGVSRPMTAALAVLFAIAPYHFVRAEAHMWLASYYPIPLAIGVVYAIIRGRPIWAWKTGGLHLGRLRIPPAVGTAAILLLVSVSNSYYAFITLLLIAISGVFTILRTRAYRRFFGAVGAGVVVAGTLAAGLIPSTLYALINGTNSSAVLRLPIEAELYSFKFTQLLLPAPQHRVAAFRALRNYYDSVYGSPAETPSLGLVAAAGFLALLGCAFLLLVSFGRRRPLIADGLISKTAALSFLTIVCFLFGTVGGFGTIISFFTSDLRGWNRISIFIAALALAGFGLLADACLRKLSGGLAASTGQRTLWVSVLGASLVLLVGVWDQTGPLLIPNYASLNASYQADQAMADEIEAATSPTAMILQLPYHPFPESMSAQGVLDSNQLRPYLHSHTLRFSGGGVKGRPASDWVQAVERLSARDVITTAVAAGFSGIFIDSADLSPTGTTLASQLQAELGSPTVTSPDGRYRFYTLASAATALRTEADESALSRIGEIAVSPVIAQFLPRFDSYTGLQLLQPYKPRISLDNDRTEPVEVRLKFTLSYTVGAASITATLPDGSRTSLAASSGGTAQELTVTVPPGVTDVSFTATEGAPVVRSGYSPGPVIASNIEVLDVELGRLLEGTAPVAPAKG
ncbi:hypothetical protein B7R54_13420 [Subtercola boreus]|uniref:Glycosyltransferase RgtA/B/C/D-like domain-containing protein n=1 Tax=Subtercola boreus TaxID=120213 RepID=A0A3E0VKC4_9MICO|nr:hypothetical protein [Subtercola boreus]RFA10099.1 hypothetical protein B7R54_13420 [Subtercola boreus]TQL52748.1 hypothetical protein FB464_0233 [Subtercola boreus]